MTETKNARISSTKIGPERGCMGSWVYLKYDGGGQGFGGYALDDKPRHEGEDRAPCSYLGIWVAGILKAVGAETWEDLPGMHCRVKARNAGVEAIGHIMKDQWFNPQEAFAESKERKDD